MLKPIKPEMHHALAAANAGHPQILAFLRASRDDLVNTAVYAAEDRMMRQAQGGVQVLDDLIAAFTFHDRLRASKT